MTLDYKLYRTSMDQLIEATQQIALLPLVEMQAFLLGAIKTSAYYAADITVTLHTVFFMITERQAMHIEAPVNQHPFQLVYHPDGLFFRRFVD